MGEIFENFWGIINKKKRNAHNRLKVKHQQELKMKEEIENLKKKNDELTVENAKMKTENLVLQKQMGVTLKFAERMVKFCAGVNAPEAEMYSNLLKTQLEACNGESVLEEAFDGLEVDDSKNSEMN